MLFGLKPVVEIYQYCQLNILAGLEGNSIIDDDIVVYRDSDSMAEALADHKHNLICLLEGAKEVHLKINKRWGWENHSYKRESW